MRECVGFKSDVGRTLDLGTAETHGHDPRKLETSSVRVCKIEAFREQENRRASNWMRTEFLAGKSASVRVWSLDVRFFVTMGISVCDCARVFLYRRVHSQNYWNLSFRVCSFADRSLNVAI